MSYIMIKGTVSVKQFVQDFEPTTLREGEHVLKLRDVFLNKRGTCGMLDCLVVEDRFSLGFYIVLTQKKNGVAIRLDPLTEPEKNAGVKRLLEVVGEMVAVQLADKSGSTGR